MTEPFSPLDGDIDSLGYFIAHLAHELKGLFIDFFVHFFAAVAQNIDHVLLQYQIDLSFRDKEWL